MYDINKLPKCTIQEPQRLHEANHDTDYWDLDENGRSYSFFSSQTGNDQPEVKNLYADDDREQELQGLTHSLLADHWLTSV